MNIAVKILLCLILFVFSISAQDVSRLNNLQTLKKTNAEVKILEENLENLTQLRDNLIEEILNVKPEDNEAAAKIGAKAVRIFPDKMLFQMIPNEEGDSFSDYFFEDIADFHIAPRISFQNGSVKVVQNEELGGFIYNLGGTLPDSLNEQNPQYVALAKYSLPQKSVKFPDSFSADGMNFSSAATVTAGNTYLIRAFNKDGDDGMFFVKIHRKDTDGSIILFVKTLKTFDSYNFMRNTEAEKMTESVAPADDYAKLELKTKIESALWAKGFTGITIDISTVPFTLRGTYPKRKIAEVMMTAMQANGGKPVRNEAFEQQQ